MKKQNIDILECKSHILTNYMHSLALDGLNHYKLVKREPTGFHDLINSLTKLDGAADADEAQKYQTACLMLINALMHSPNEEFVRVQLESEFIELGIEDAMKKIRGSQPKLNETLEIQLQVLEEELKTQGQASFKSIMQVWWNISLNEFLVSFFSESAPHYIETRRISCSSYRFKLVPKKPHTRRL